MVTWRRFCRICMLRFKRNSRTTSSSTFPMPKIEWSRQSLRTSNGFRQTTKFRVSFQHWLFCTKWVFKIIFNLNNFLFPGTLAENCTWDIWRNIQSCFKHNLYINGAFVVGDKVAWTMLDWHYECRLVLTTILLFLKILIILVVSKRKLSHCDLEYVVDMKSANDYNIKPAEIKKPDPFVNLLALNIVGAPSSNGKETQVLEKKCSL